MFSDPMQYNIQCGDNLEVIGGMESQTFSASINDPPYGLQMAQWDKHVPSVETWEEVYRVLKPGAFMLSFSAPDYYHKMATNIEVAGFRPLGVISWLITTKMIKKNRLKPAQELIFVGQKPLEGSIEANFQRWNCGKINIETGRVRWEKEPPVNLSNGHSRRAFGGNVVKSRDQNEKLSVMSSPNGRYPSDVIGYFDDPEIQKFFYAPRVSRTERGHYNDHPTPKPIALIRYLCRLFGGPEGETIVDPFMGSGSTGIAALQEGYRFCGIDIDEHYCDIARRRILEHCPGGDRASRSVPYQHGSTGVPGISSMYPLGSDTIRRAPSPPTSGCVCRTGFRTPATMSRRVIFASGELFFTSPQTVEIRG